MARACTAAAASTLAAAVMAMDRAYADGPFHFPLFSSPSSASSPAAAAAPEVPPAGDPRPKAEEPPRVRNDNPRTTAAGFDPEALVRGAEAVREIDKSHNAKKVWFFV